MKCNKNAIAAVLVFASLLSLGHATSALVDTSTQQSSGFTDGTIDPFTVCTTEGANYGEAYTLDTIPCMKFYWEQAQYDGTRETKGAEACSDISIYKEGWYGFRFYLPIGGYPNNKTAVIAQIFQHGSCNSWAAQLAIVNGDLHLYYRGNCAAGNDVTIATGITYSSWRPILIHFIASHANAGTIQVWYGGATSTQASPTINLTGINFGFGTWDTATDTLTSGNDLVFKFGQYNIDPANYTPGETRTNYFDNVCQLVGNPTHAWTIANPAIN